MANYLQTGTLAVLLSLGCSGAFAAPSSASFVENASAKGVAEVEAGKLAQQKGVAADVKSFAQMMVSDHTAANQKLQSIAQQKKLKVSDHAQMMDKAKAMIMELRNAKSFDQAYANNQVKAHEATIKLFEDEASNGTDADLKAFAMDTLPKLKAHLAEAQKLAAAHGGDAANN